jgi:hypothetical protein
MEWNLSGIFICDITTINVRGRPPFGATCFTTPHSNLLIASPPLLQLFLHYSLSKGASNNGSNNPVYKSNSI